MFQLNFITYYFLKHFGSSGWNVLIEQADAEVDNAIFVQILAAIVTITLLMEFFHIIHPFLSVMYLKQSQLCLKILFHF